MKLDRPNKVLQLIFIKCIEVVAGLPQSSFVAFHIEGSTRRIVEITVLASDLPINKWKIENEKADSYKGLGPTTVLKKLKIIIKNT